MGVGGGDHVGPGGVDLGVDGEGSGVDRPPAFDDLAVVVEEDEVGTLIWLKGSPNGLTQKWSASSGSRAVM